MAKIVLEKKHGLAWISEEAEKVRKGSCLCIREEKGEMVMCERLKQNIALEKNIGKQKIMEFLQQKALSELELLANNARNGTVSEFMSSRNYCPLALINYALCLFSGMANAVSRCPFYLSPEKTDNF